MQTITHEQYLALNAIRRDGRKEKSDIPLFGFLKTKLWITPSHDLDCWSLSNNEEWELSSAGILEHNLYEKINRYSDGCKLKNSGCPRCPICLGYGSHE